MKAVADVLGVARSNLARRSPAPSLQSPATVRPRARVDDVALLDAIRGLVDERPSYGYRRITVLLNRERRAKGLPAVNRKRVLRIMQINGLVLAPETVAAIGKAEARRNRWTAAALWAIALLLGAIALMLV